MKLKPHSIYKKRGKEEYVKTDFLVNKELIWTHRMIKASSPCGFIRDDIGAGVKQIPVKEFLKDFRFVKSVK